MSALVEEARVYLAHDHEFLKDQAGGSPSDLPMDALLLGLSMNMGLMARLADALEAAERERDEALALTESCSTLKEMAAACIEGADLKRRTKALRAHLPALKLARETFKEHDCEWAFNSLYEVVRVLEEGG